MSDQDKESPIPPRPLNEMGALPPEPPLPNPPEWNNPNSVQQFLDSLWKRAAFTFQQQYPQIEIDKIEATKDQKYCLLVNSLVVLTLVNNFEAYKKAGIAYTVHTYPQHPQTEQELPPTLKGNLGFHTIGIIKIGPARYAAFDLTNKFVVIGNLPQLTQKLDEAFIKSGSGISFDLDFEYPTGSPNATDRLRLSVGDKLDFIEESLANDSFKKPISLENDILQPERNDIISKIWKNRDFQAGNHFARRWFGITYRPLPEHLQQKQADPEEYYRNRSLHTYSHA